jgi:hypothetical protein
VIRTPLQKYDHLMAGDMNAARDAVRAAFKEYSKERSPDSSTPR